jgi:putative nucleotidyltransferase with HDIG domain
MPTTDTDEAKALARELLADALPRRYAHVLGVGQRARSLVDQTMPEGSSGLLEVAGILHDIGYAPALQETGFHPIDGARHLRSLGFDEQVVNLVAHHSCSRVEADLRGLGGVLADEFPIDPSLPHTELCFCDMTTSPSGEPITVEERLADITDRYGPASVVGRFVSMAGDELRAAVATVEAQIQPR